jgi:hypothetical protein
MQETKDSRSLILPRRSEIIVKLPVQNGIKSHEGIINRSEIADEIYLPSSLVRVKQN